MDDRHERYGAIRQLVREELRDMVSVKSLRKNGDTWPSWLMKIFTLDRIVGGIALIFLLGQRTQLYTGNIAGAVNDIKQIQDTQMAFRDQTLNEIQDLRQLVLMQQKLVDDRSALVARLAKDTDTRISATVTRGEYNRMTNQIIQRLDRIEQQVNSQAR